METSRYHLGESRHQKNLQTGNLPTQKPLVMTNLTVCELENGPVEIYLIYRHGDFPIRKLSSPLPGRVVGFARCHV